MKKLFISMMFLLFLAQACGPLTLVPAPTAVSTVAPMTPSGTPVSVTEAPVTESAPGLEGLGGVPCPESDFTCVTLTVPLNHFDSSDPRTIEVVFAILPATGERKGMFVTATGGPGSAGISSADDYTSYFDPSIPEHFDIVFFDQRGVGQSGGLQCVNAAAKFYLSDWSAGTLQEESAMAESARAFSTDCVTEMGDSEMLSYIGTEQAVEDLEAFRKAIGDEKLWLYGESYGTQYSQTYAAAHPDHLAGLILDGTVDLTLSGFDFYEQQARAFSDTLELTLQACNADDICAESMGGGDAGNAYIKLAERLKQAPIEFTFPLPSGGTIKRTFSFSDLETSASSYMYSASERMIFLRALAAYSRNEDLAPMARVLYNSLALDPETLDAIPDPTWSDAVFYGVECQDYGYISGTPEERANAYLRAGDKLDASIPYFSSIFYGDMPCMFWPNARTDQARPAPLTADGIPTLVLGAIADPATPVENGLSVFRRLSDGYLITQEGGPHVIYGRGVACIDDLVTNFLIDDQMPDQRKTSCEGTVTSEFAALAPLDAHEFASPLEALSSADDEIYYLPEYYYWDGITSTSVGCPFGGTLSFEATDTGDALTLTDCSFSQGFSLTGSGINNYDDGSFALEVDVTGLNSGTLTYTRDGDGKLYVTGTFGGKDVNLSE
ncbi:MAG: alpha/beta fold hydrolase [Chloroflexi bacterium]|nr:alpha/beta fold hydrolase [Chloroflexota bacterium]